MKTPIFMYLEYDLRLGRYGPDKLVLIRVAIYINLLTD